MTDNQPIITDTQKIHRIRAVASLVMDFMFFIHPKLRYVTNSSDITLICHIINIHWDKFHYVSTAKPLTLKTKKQIAEMDMWELIYGVTKEELYKLKG